MSIHSLIPKGRIFFQNFLGYKRQLHASKLSSALSDLLLEKEPTALVTALSLSESTKSSILGTQIHGRVIKLALISDIFLQNNLIKMYLKCALFGDALKLFDEMAHKNVVSWTLIISAAVQREKFDLGLETFLEMIRAGLMPNEFALGSIMKVPSALGAREFGLSVHCIALKIDIERNPFVACSTLNFYAKFGDIWAAERVFTSADNLDIGCWNGMIGGYAQCGCGFEALKLVSLMICKRITRDKYTFINALQGCSVVGDLNFGRQTHGLIIRSEVESSTSIFNALLDMYVQCGGKETALKVFRRMANKDVVTWNTIFGGFSQYEDPKEVASLFHDFMLAGMRPNHVTFSILFRQCSVLLAIDLGLQFCSIALHLGLLDEATVTSSLINMFSRCGAIEMAHSVFDSVPFDSIIAWNELISGYNFNCCHTEALYLFRNVWELGVRANESTFSNILEACCSSGNHPMARQIHGAAVKSGFASHDFVFSSLIIAYVKFGLLGDSLEFFNGLERLDMASWGSTISALVHQGYSYEAIRLFSSLIKAGVMPDEYILASILNSCAGIGAFSQTKSVHSFIIKLGFDMHVFVASAVIDAYAKSGNIESARIAFDQSFESKDVIIYNTMIMAYAHHGFASEAMRIFERMKLAKLKPSHATFVSLISACSHSGLVDQGRLLFESMDLEYGIEPCPGNYGCFVDMLSRNGLLEDAKNIIEAMPGPPWPAILRSLLSGCRKHGNRELGEWAAEKLLQLVPDNDAAYVFLSKFHCEAGSWEKAAKVNKGMVGRRILKHPGYSWIGT